MFMVLKLSRNAHTCHMIAMLEWLGPVLLLDLFMQTPLTATPSSAGVGSVSNCPGHSDQGGGSGMEQLCRKKRGRVLWWSSGVTIQTAKGYDCLYLWNKEQWVINGAINSLSCLNSNKYQSCTTLGGRGGGGWLLTGGSSRSRSWSRMLVFSPAVTLASMCLGLQGCAGCSLPFSLAMKLENKMSQVPKKRISGTQNRKLNAQLITTMKKDAEMVKNAWNLLTTTYAVVVR